MAIMPDIEAEAARAAGWLTARLHHHAPATQATAAATIEHSNPGGPVSVFTEAKTILHDVVQRLETIDEGAVQVVEAAKVNSTAVSIINTVAGIAHVPDPDGLLAQADSMLKAVAAALARAAAATVPAADATAAPAGPQVAGQA